METGENALKLKKLILKIGRSRSHSENNEDDSTGCEVLNVVDWSVYRRTARIIFVTAGFLLAKNTFLN